MHEILKIKISSLILFILPFVAILLPVFTLNHIVTYDQDWFPQGKVGEYIIECNEQNSFCSKLSSSKDNFRPTKLTECSLLAYKTIYTANNKEINGKQAKLLKENKKKFYYEIIKTNETNSHCIKNSKTYFLYKLIPSAENIFVYWKNNADVGVSKTVNPFINGETSISNIVKRVPFNFIFKPLMFIASFFMLIYWISYRSFFLRNSVKQNNKFVYFGILSSFCLFFHVFFLGTNIDIPAFDKIRKLILVLFIVFEVLAEFFLARRIYINKEYLKNIMNENIIKFKMIFVYIVLTITILSFIYGIYFNPTSKFNNILEWNYFIFLLFFYFLSAIIWKKN
ncbi:hypothetical protein N8745_00905 [Candidatus Pelagibacter sp.]|nr:hypothetical protein [Candidatus Pelagibacter sp.]